MQRANLHNGEMKKVWIWCPQMMELANFVTITKHLAQVYSDQSFRAAQM